MSNVKKMKPFTSACSTDWRLFHLEALKANLQDIAEGKPTRFGKIDEYIPLIERLIKERVAFNKKQRQWGECHLHVTWLTEYWVDTPLHECPNPMGKCSELEPPPDYAYEELGPEAAT